MSMLFFFYHFAELKKGEYVIYNLTLYSEKLGYIDYKWIRGLMVIHWGCSKLWENQTLHSGRETHSFTWILVGKRGFTYSVALKFHAFWYSQIYCMPRFWLFLTWILIRVLLSTFPCVWMQCIEADSSKCIAKLSSFCVYMTFRQQTQ